MKRALQPRGYRASLHGPAAWPAARAQTFSDVAPPRLVGQGSHGPAQVQRQVTVTPPLHREVAPVQKGTDGGRLRTCVTMSTPAVRAESVPVPRSGKQIPRSSTGFTLSSMSSPRCHWEPPSVTRWGGLSRAPQLPQLSQQLKYQKDSNPETQRPRARTSLQSQHPRSHRPGPARRLPTAQLCPR